MAESSQFLVDSFSELWEISGSEPKLCNSVAGFNDSPRFVIKDLPEKIIKLIYQIFKDFLNSKTLVVAIFFCIDPISTLNPFQFIKGQITIKQRCYVFKWNKVLLVTYSSQLFS